MNHQVFDGTNIIAKFAVISDLHITERAKARANQRCRRAFEKLYTAMHGKMDALVIAGDITDWGTTEQIRQFKSIVDSNLKPETELFAAIGNHDIHDNMFDSHLGGMPFYNILGKRMYEGASTEEITVGNYHRVINGLHFIALTLRDYHSGRHEEEDLTWLRKQLKEAQADKPEYPIFLATHPVLQNTIYGSNEGTYWHSSNLVNVLHDFPQTVVFSGHLHFPLNDERIIYQDGYTAVGTSTLVYCSLSPKYKGIDYLEITSGLEPYDCQIVSQALIVEVDANTATRIRRYDIISDTYIKQPWILPPLTTGEKPYTLHERIRQNKAPQFPQGAMVRITALSDLRMTLTFPAAIDDDMVNSYEITLKPLSGGKILRKIMTYSDFYHHAQVEDMNKTITRTITAKYLNCHKLNKTYNIIVRAIDSFGAFSQPIVNNSVQDATYLPEEFPEIPTLLSDTICHKLYDFSFWKQGRQNIGEITDTSAYLGDCDGAGIDYKIDAVTYGENNVTAMKFTVLYSDVQSELQSILIKTDHPNNPYSSLTYPDSVALSYFVDASDWKGALNMYPIICEQDFCLDGTSAGISLFAPRAKYSYYIEQDDILHKCEGQGAMCLPKGYVGRVYLLLDAETVEPVWGTQDKNSRFDGIQINYIRFVLTNLSESGSSFILRDIAIHTKS